MDAAPDISVSAAPAAADTLSVETPVPEAASADLQAKAESARLAVVRHAQVLSAMQAAQDAVVAAVRGMARPPPVDA